MHYIALSAGLVMVQCTQCWMNTMYTKEGSSCYQLSMPNNLINKKKSFHEKYHVRMYVVRFGVLCSLRTPLAYMSSFQRSSRKCHTSYCKCCMCIDGDKKWVRFTWRMIGWAQNVKIEVIERQWSENVQCGGLGTVVATYISYCKFLSG